MNEHTHIPFPPDGQLPRKGLGGSAGFFSWSKAGPGESLSLRHPPAQPCQRLVISKETDDWGTNESGWESASLAGECTLPM